MQCLEERLNKLSHPYLLLPKGHEKKVLESVVSDSIVRKTHAYIKAQADVILNKPMVDHMLTGKRMLSVSNEVLRRVFYLSYIYRITDDKKYASRAIAEIMEVCKFLDWNPAHFLDVAEMTLAVAIGYDWLYDQIKEEDRKLIITAINDKAFSQVLRVKRLWLLKISNNWNSVCNAGLLYGALATANEIPEESLEIINLCLESNRKALDLYYPDGGYAEGFGYWGYGTNFQVLLFDALAYFFDDKSFFEGNQGFLDTGKYAQNMVGPSGECFNYSDVFVLPTGKIALWWFAEKNNDLSLLYNEHRWFKGSVPMYSEIRLLPALSIFASRIKNYAILCPRNNFYWSYGDTPVYTYRSGWDSTSDAYLGVKGGAASTSHAHMDSGSFVYEYGGVRWAIDLGAQNYNSLESKGVDLWNYKQNSQRWDILRMRNDYHNTLTVNGERHLINGKANFINTFASKEKKGVIIDLSNTLGKVKKAHREIYLNSKDQLIVTDTVETGSNGIQLKWIMVTLANATIVNDTIILLKDGKKMNMVFDSSHDYKLQIWNNNPIHDYDEPNSGTLRVGFISDIPARNKAVFSVYFKACEEQSISLANKN